MYMRENGNICPFGVFSPYFKVCFVSRLDIFRTLSRMFLVGASLGPERGKKTNRDIPGFSVKSYKHQVHFANVHFCF